MRCRRGEDGFGLIELMVTVLVIAVLLAVSIPTFLAARTRAQDRAAQSEIRNAHVAQAVYYADEEEYTTEMLPLMRIDPSLQYAPSPYDGTSTITAKELIHVRVSTTNDIENNTVLLAQKSGSGTCFWMRTVATEAYPRFAKTDCDPPTNSDFKPQW